MATVRTLDQLIALWIDNDVGAISAADGRDFIASTFGFFSSSGDPTAADDRADTAGAGAYFDRGSRWLNVSTGQPWICLTGFPTAAVWRALAYDGEPAGGRLAGQWPIPTLAASGVTAGAYGDASNYPTFTVQADGTLTAAGVLPLPTFSGVVQVHAGHYMSIGGTTSNPVVDWVGPLVAGDLPNHSAALLTSGTLDDARLSNTGITATSYGDSSHVATFTVDAHGRLTAAASVAISAGTVSSVAMTAPSWLTVGGSPITTTGTLAVTATTGQTAAKVLGTPAATTGAVDLISLGVQHIPSLPASQVTSGTFSLGLIPSLPGSQITSGGLSAAFVDTGTLPLAVVPVLTSAQLPTGSAVNALAHATGTTTAAFATVFTKTYANGIHGILRFANQGVGAINYRWTVSDVWNALTQVGSTQTLTAGNALVVDFHSGAPTGFPAASKPPYTSVLLETQDFSLGVHQGWEVYASTVG